MGQSKEAGRGVNQKESLREREKEFSMNTIKKILSPAILLTLVFALPGLQAATTGTVDGFVKDLKTGQLLEGVKITLISEKTQLAFELKTDKRGHFHKSGIIPGKYKILIEKEGYIPQGGSIRVFLAKTMRLEYKIESAESSSHDEPASAEPAASGMELISAGKYAEAITKLSKIIEQAPLNPVPYFYRGLAYERSGYSEEALEDYRKATELKTDFILPYTRSGILWAKQGNFEKAIEFYKKSLNSGDQDSATHYNYGACLINLGKKEEARSTFETLIDQDPDYSDAYYQLGIIYLSAGEIDRAIELLETFIAKDPENNKAPQTREILKTLKEKRSAAD